MQPVTVAFFWHQHQPYYPDDVSNETLMPWVRLHATKDYYGMALHLKEVPEFRCTINLVPSLLIQLQAYGEGRSDRHLDVSRLPTDGMSEADVCYLLDNFFLANVESMIRPYERYHELYLRRGFGTRSGRECRFPLFSPATCATCKSGATSPGFTSWSSTRTPSCASSAPRAAATPKAKRRGSSTSRKPS